MSWPFFMKLTYSMLLADFLANTGLESSVAIIAFFNRALQTRYQDALSAFSSWKNQQTQSTTTVIGQQYYSYPPGVVNIEAATLQQGTIVYPIRVVNSQEEWNYINQYPNTNTIIPQFVFPRQYDFGVFPIPQAENTLVLNFIYTTPPLNQTDYITGTTSVINGSQSVSSSGASFTTNMVGRYFVLTDTSGFPTDFWYRITGANDATDVLTLQSYYEGVTISGSNYIVGQVPELPDEAHILLSWGVTADWFASRGDTKKSSEFNNLYYTGDPTNAQRFGKNILGGIIGLRERYSTRSDKKIVTMNKKSKVNYYINWVNSITSS